MNKSIPKLEHNYNSELMGNVLNIIDNTPQVGDVLLEGNTLSNNYFVDSDNRRVTYRSGLSVLGGGGGSGSTIEGAGGGGGGGSFFILSGI
jgi:hypothetical protein